MKSERRRRLIEQSADRRRTRRLALALGGLLFAAIVLVYGQVWRFDFVIIDDPIYVSNNVNVREGLSWPNVVWSVSAFHDGNWIPLTWLSLMLDSDLYGSPLRAAGYHATNVLLHAANSLLLFAVIARATRRLLPSAFVAALFALHPLHVESVAWVAERKDVLSTLFGMLALLEYVNYVAPPPPAAAPERRRHLVLSGICFVCSLLSKPTLVTLPFVFLLLDFWPLRRLALESDNAPPIADRAGTGVAGESARRRDGAGSPPPTRPKRTLARLLLEKSPFLAISLLFCAIAIKAQDSGHAVSTVESLPIVTRCLNAVVVYGAYVGLTCFPLDLAVFYPLRADGFSASVVLVSAVFLAATTVGAVVWRRRYPCLFVGWAWYLGTLVPMIGLVQIGRQQMADRYTYFPLIGIFWAATWLVVEWVPAGLVRRRIVPGLSIACLALLAAAAFRQAGYWHDSVRLFNHAIEAGYDSGVARSALGSALVQQGRTAEGVENLESAVRLDPKDAEAKVNLAGGLEAEGKFGAAAEQYQAALVLDDADPRAHTNLARILWKQKKYADAIQHFRRAIEIDPDHASAYVNLAALYGQIGKFSDSIACNERALQLDPTLAICHYNIAMALRAQGRLDLAIGRLQYLLSVAPDYPDARRELERTVALKRNSTGG